MIDLLLIALLVGPTLILRACRPSPIPRATRTWFDVVAGNTTTKRPQR